MKLKENFQKKEFKWLMNSLKSFEHHQVSGNSHSTFFVTPSNPSQNRYHKEIKQEQSLEQYGERRFLLSC